MLISRQMVFVVCLMRLSSVVQMFLLSIELLITRVLLYMISYICYRKEFSSLASTFLSSSDVQQCFACINLIVSASSVF